MPAEGACAQRDRRSGGDPPRPSATPTGRPAEEQADLGELVDQCDLCIGRPRGCRLAPDGAHWCGSRSDYMPGYRVVGTTGALTGYRQRRANEPISAEASVRSDAWLAEHTRKTAEANEDKARCAAVAEAGLLAISPARLVELLADVIASAPVVIEHSRDISDLAALLVARGAAE